MARFVASSWGVCQSLNAGHVSYARDPVADALPTIVLASDGEILATLGICTHATNRHGMDRIYVVLFDRRARWSNREVSRNAARGTRLLCPSNVWREADFERWDLDICFDPTAPGFFTIMQSNTKIPAREVRRQLMNYLPLHI